MKSAECLDELKVSSHDIGPIISNPTGSEVYVSNGSGIYDLSLLKGLHPNDENLELLED